MSVKPRMDIRFRARSSSIRHWIHPEKSAQQVKHYLDYCLGSGAILNNMIAHVLPLFLGIIAVLLTTLVAGLAIARRYGTTAGRREAITIGMFLVAALLIVTLMSQSATSRTHLCHRHLATLALSLHLQRRALAVLAPLCSITTTNRA